jgi:hypothetical protein
MMICRALSPAVPDLRPARRLAGPAQPLAGVQGRGTTRAAARSRRAAPCPSRPRLDWADRAVLAALIRPRTAWARRPAQDQDLVAEHQDLGVLGRLRPGEQGDPAEYTKKHQVEQAYGHRSHPARAQAPVPAKPQIRLCDTVTGTHTARGRYPRSTGPGAQPGGRTPPFRINSHAGESRCLPPSR